MFDTSPIARLEDLQDEYDYFIVGGGTAGCVLANRLSSDQVTVLVVEAGTSDNGWLSRNPYFSFHHASSGHQSHVTESVPQRHADNRTFNLVRGRTLGGTSKINAALYARGIPAEYNEWSRNGRIGWSYGEIEKYFVRGDSSGLR
ncbi:hypothetical protein EIP91_010054 [Steccherinum ochraceum]|uniref:Glucose-methanol-choline oxidoreductase N-terminal domain-containing protein n=1 Tax=Steccherinum ochraceum TaxID=92696 RepID=A0A4R0R0Z3_9APHY|nr:hypothetical protein EIP91_010054 [Steccherinum ochraceum]